MIDKAYFNWLDSMNWQINFYKKSFSRKRVDNEFDWAWDNSQKSWKDKLKPYAWPIVKLSRRWRKIPFTQCWLNENSGLLWNSRRILCDDLSKLLFDCYLLLTTLDHTKYYYPRIDYDDFIAIQSEEDFVSDLPKDYIGLPLKIYKVKLNSGCSSPEAKIVTTKSQIALLNTYRQYLIKRGELDFSPSTGEVVFDCGSCIGDISMIFASLVGNSGEVHLFDPVPLHNQYSCLQAKLNPMLGQILRVNNLGVGDISTKFSGIIHDSNTISPGGCSVNNFETTSLDDYVSKNNVQRVDYIKMDIEGYEIAALRGASKIISKFKPRLAISTYHKPEDLWEIPSLILKLNPEYKIYFGHHSPKRWEAVYYAT